MGLELCVVRLESTLRDALVSLDRSGRRIVMIEDSEARVVGLLTDGDLRRALLSGAGLEDAVRPHVRANFTWVSAGTSRADVLDLMQARRILEVPVLDEKMKLAGLHMMHDVLAREQRQNWAVVMAGGRGTRLAPLTEDTPKPMLRVAGRPILERIVLHLAGVGIRRIFLAINYLGHIVEEHFGDGQRFGCQIEYLREEKPLGTAGALGLIVEEPRTSLLVMNGDLVTQADLGEMIDRHEAMGAAITVGTRRYLHTVPFGCLDIHHDRVVGLDEKPTLSRVINAGIYVLAPAVLGNIPKDKASTMPELVSNAIAHGNTVLGHEIVDDWVDVGQKDQLKQARGEES